VKLTAQQQEQIAVAKSTGRYGAVPNP